MNSELVSFLWSFTSASLLIFILLSVFIFYRSRERIYGLYALYNFVLLIYVVAIGNYFWDKSVVYTRYYGLYWFIQVGYHYIHILFGIRMLSIHQYFPKLAFQLRRVALIELLICTCVLLYEIIFGIIRAVVFIDFFLYFHLPFYILVAIIVLSKTFYHPNSIKWSFFSGSVLYAILAFIAVVKTFGHDANSGELDPIFYFYIGILLEVFFFTYGLGIRVWQVQQAKIHLEQTNLKLQKQLQRQLEEHLVLQQQQYQLLQAETEKEKLNNELFVLRNRVLKNQLKSHFIFNVINSIKAHVIDREKRDAVDYINLFAKFIRKSFEINFSDNTNLEEELQALELYLSIEKKRISKPFEYNINISPEVDVKGVQLPTMLLQPFVENGLWHGIQKSEREGLLQIAITRPDTKTVLIEIDDNGPGWDNPEKTAHLSKGLKITDDRISLFNQSMHGKTIHYNILNKADFGDTSGVIIRLYITT